MNIKDKKPEFKKSGTSYLTLTNAIEHIMFSHHADTTGLGDSYKHTY